MLDINFKNFIGLSSEKKELILKWRNSDRIRLKMLNQNIILLENHLQWIDKLQNRNDCLYFLFSISNIPVGVFDYTEIENKSCVAGSYIGNEEFIGYGILLNYLGLKYAFEELNFERINISVLKNNKRVYKMHKTIFLANDIKEDEQEYFLYFDKQSWFENQTIIRDYIQKAYDDNLNIKWE